MADKPHKTGCRVCGKKELKARGLCEAHFQRFRLKLRSLASAAEREAYETELVELGWVAAKASPGRKASADIFDVVAEKVVEDRATYRTKSPTRRKRRTD